MERRKEESWQDFLVNQEMSSSKRIEGDKEWDGQIIEYEEGFLSFFWHFVVYFSANHKMLVGKRMRKRLVDLAQPVFFPL